MIRMQPSVENAQTIAESDAVAVERTLAGDRDAFRVLVERHSHNVFRLAYRMTGNRPDAEEVVQEAFLRAYQKLGQFAARANFGTWVYRIAANYAIDRMRQRKKEEARKVEPAVHEEGTENDPVTLVHDAAPTPERLTQNIELRKQMEIALAALSHSERTAFVMRHWEGCAIEEIAQVLKSSSGAAKNTVFRAVQKLRLALQQLMQLPQGMYRAVEHIAAIARGAQHFRVTAIARQRNAGIRQHLGQMLAASGRQHLRLADNQRAVQAERGDRVDRIKLPVRKRTDRDFQAMRHPFQTVGQFFERRFRCRGAAQLEHDFRFDTRLQRARRADGCAPPPSSRRAPI